MAHEHDLRMLRQGFAPAFQDPLPPAAASWWSKSSSSWPVTQFGAFSSRESGAAFVLAMLGLRCCFCTSDCKYCAGKDSYPQEPNMVRGNFHFSKQAHHFSWFHWWFSIADSNFPAQTGHILRQCLSPNGLVLNGRFLGPDAGEQRLQDKDAIALATCRASEGAMSEPVSEMQLLAFSKILGDVAAPQVVGPQEMGKWWSTGILGDPIIRRSRWWHQNGPDEISIKFLAPSCNPTYVGHI